MKPFLPAITCLCLLFSCTSSEIGNSKDVNPETIYTRYEISYSEGDETVQCVARFRFAGSNGTTLVLTNPSDVQLDGISLKADSNKISGAFYSADKPFIGFEGQHTLVFTDINSKVYTNSFPFNQVKLTTTIPGNITGEGLPLTFEGLQDGDVIHTEVGDTSSTTEDINRLDTIHNGKILLSAADLARFKNGPITFGFYMDTDTPLKNTPAEGGVLNLRYVLKQQKTILKK